MKGLYDMNAKAGTIIIELSREEADYVRSLTFRDWIGELTPGEPENEKFKTMREDMYRQLSKVMGIGK